MNRYNFGNFKSRRKDSSGKRKLNILAKCNEISFFNSFSIFVGKPLGPTHLLSFNDKIKLVISSGLVGLKKKEFSLGYWRNSSNDLFENLTFALVFSTMVLK